MISSREHEYQCNGIDLFNIRNRNERRVINAMPRILKEYPGYRPSSIDIRDIYALSLNSLSPRYVQLTAIVLKEPVTDEKLDNAVRGAVERVMKFPKADRKSRSHNIQK